MSEKRDYYEVLGVPKDADDNTIKRAFWKLAKKYHPDVNPDDAEAEQKFKEANEAYEVLSDKEKRQRYDQFGHAGIDGQGFNGGFSGGFGINLEDIFSQIFGDFGFGFGGNNRSGYRHQGPIHGANLRYRMNLDFMEAAFGTEREIKIRKEDLCKTCNGYGTKDGKEPPICGTCNGTGQVSGVQQTIFGQVRTSQTCNNCHGSGRAIEDPCPDCMGTGRTMITKRLNVTVPAGINEREMLTLTGEGEPGTQGAPNGDLYIEIHIKPHEVFSRQGNTTFCVVPVTYAQAAIGQEITVPTIDGSMPYKLKAGTQSGDIYTIHNKGIPYINRRNSRGDHKFQIELEVPQNLSKEQEDLLEKFEASMKDENYKKRRGFFDAIKKLFSDFDTKKSK